MPTPLRPNHYLLTFTVGREGGGSLKEKEKKRKRERYVLIDMVEPGMYHMYMYSTMMEEGPFYRNTACIPSLCCIIQHYALILRVRACLLHT